MATDSVRHPLSGEIDAATCDGLDLFAIRKAFAGKVALDGVAFCVPRHAIVAVLGPSGSGKSTLLSIIAGLESPDGGSVLWDGKPIDSLPAHQRGFGLMFQDYVLFPHLNVERNVAFGLQMQRLDEAQRRARVRECLAQVGLTGFEGREVQTLSGGEQQRVALARALAPRPRLLMLDEPLGALDRALRERLLGEMRQVLRAARQTALVVTHDQEQAFGLADRIVILDGGRLLQQGEPQQVYRHPASAAVARFLGLTNLLAGTPEAGGIRTALGLVPLAASSVPRPTVLLRPEAARLDDSGTFAIDATLRQRTFRGPTCFLEVEAGGLRLTFEVPSAAALPSEGERVRLSFDPQAAFQVLP